MWWGDYTFAIAFYATAAVAVAAGFMVIWHRNPVISALYLVVCFFAVAVCYVLLHAHFLAAVQVLLYAGAVLVLFLMLIMLMNLDEKSLGRARPSIGKVVGGAAVFGFILIMVTGLFGFQYLHQPNKVTRTELVLFLIGIGEDRARFEGVAPSADKALNPEQLALVASALVEDYGGRDLKPYIVLPPEMEEIISQDRRDGTNYFEALRSEVSGKLEREKSLATVNSDRPGIGNREIVEFVRALARGRLDYMEEFGTTRSVGRLLFSRYFLPFEAASMLLLAAIVGVLVLARGKPGGSL